MSSPTATTALVRSQAQVQIIVNASPSLFLPLVSPFLPLRFLSYAPNQYFLSIDYDSDTLSLWCAEGAFRVFSRSFTLICIHSLKQNCPQDCFVPCQPHSRLSYSFSMACRKKGPNFLACLPRPSRIWLYSVCLADSLLLSYAYLELQLNQLLDFITF